MSEYDVIGLGMSAVDVAIQLEHMPTWENPGRISGFTLADGGAAGTACYVAATFGLRTGFIDTFGTDEMGARKKRSLEQVGVDISRMVRREGPEDNIVIVYVQEQTAERCFAFNKAMWTHPIRPEELDRGYIKSASYLHMDGSHVQASIEAARWAHQEGKTVVLDAGKDQPLSPEMQALVAETDILICGSGFAPKLTGKKDIWEAGRAALKKGPHIVVQTEGVNGSYTTSAEEEFHTKAFKVDVVDTTGAGDVFHGAYLVGLVRGWNLQQIATFASAVSAIHCTVLGNRKGIPSLEQVKQFLHEHQRSE
jgi:sulfofructose kinase